jgi:hypothetical protein
MVNKTRKGRLTRKGRSTTKRGLTRTKEGKIIKKIHIYHLGGASPSDSVCPPPKCQYNINCPHNPIKKGNVFCSFHTKRGQSSLTNYLSGYELPYDPDSYNKDRAKQLSNNCYEYALALFDPKKTEECRTKNICEYAIAGEKQGHKNYTGRRGKSCSDIIMRTMATSNGLLSTHNHKCKKGYRKIAIVVDQRRDFHYYRQDSDGWWSHKPGSTEVTNKDSYGAKIFRPDLASRCYKKIKSDDGLNYDSFCCYMCIPTTIT